MTLRYVYDQDKAIARAVAASIPHCDPRGFPANTRSIGILDRRNRIVGGILFYNWNPAAGTIEMAAAALPGAYWFSRETIRRAFGFAFSYPGCQMVKMQVLADDDRLLHQLSGFGFDRIFVPRLYGRDRDGVLCTFTDDDWAASRFNRLPDLRQKDAA